MVETIFHQHRYARELDKLVTQGCAWLDIGAGEVIHRSWLPPSSIDLAARPSYLAGCDLDPAVLRNSYLHEKRIASASDLPWADETFDVVSANMVVEHLAEPRLVMREVRRVLKPGGHFVFVTPNKNHPVIFTASLLVPEKLRRAYAIRVEGRSPEDAFPTTYRCNTQNTVRTIAAEACYDIATLEVFDSEFPLFPGALGRIERKVMKLLMRTNRGGALGAGLLAVLRKPTPERQA